VNATIETFQASLDEWVHEYNTNRPHQSLEDRPPQERLPWQACASRPTTPKRSKTVRNDNPRPFVWHKPAQEIITKVRRGRSSLRRVISATDH
jgi:hypothetical protein